MNELTKRIIFSSLGAIAFVSFLYAGGHYFLGGLTVVSMILSWEISRIFTNAGYHTDFWPTIFLTLGWMSIPYHNYGLSFMVVGLFIIIIKETLNGDHKRYISILTTSFAAMYPAWGLFSLYEIRMGMGMDNDAFGWMLTLSVMFMIWGNDVFAYFGGKGFGKHKMAPEISPGKSWEGFFSGILGSLIVLIFYYYVFPSYFEGYSFTELLPLVLVISLLGPIGDLSESKIKRFANMKDSSNLFPGHGGFFDRFDSVLLVAPAVIVYFQILAKF